MDHIAVRRALLSVSDKTGIVELAKTLVGHGVELLSTGGTYRTLAEAKLPVTELASYTGFPEILEGRVKTLHPKVHGGLLFRRDRDDDVATTRRHGIEPIDLVVVNLYPFEQTVARPGVELAEAIEQIDIGGPSMIRSAAKNHAHVAVLTDPGQYPAFREEFERLGGALSRQTAFQLAVAAFGHTSNYDRAIHAYLSRAAGATRLTGSTAGAEASPQAGSDLFPRTVSLTYERKSILRYGENPHQRAAFYIDPQYRPASVASAKVLHGKELSYNNLLDLDAALAIVREFRRPAAVVIKHNNPCGAAVADSLVDAFEKAYAGDPLSAFGSVLGFNQAVDHATAEKLCEPGRFVEAIIAPAFSHEALSLLTTKPSWRQSVRLLAVGDLQAFAEERLAAVWNRPLEGGLLRQTADLGPNGSAEGRVVTSRAPTTRELRDLDFSFTLVKHVRSNAIVVAKDEAVLGVGAGQMSRVDSVQIAVSKAGPRAAGAVLASDAFFPFRDNVDLAAKAGIAAIVQPGGSKRDQESIDACNEHGIAMVFTGVRHFKH